MALRRFISGLAVSTVLVGTLHVGSASAVDDGLEMGRGMNAVSRVPGQPIVSGNVQFPADASRPLTARGGLRVHLPGSGESAKTAGRNAGEAAYPDVAAGTALVAQELSDDTFRIMSIADSAESPERLAYRFDSDSGATLVADGMGGAFILDKTSNLLGQVGAPWAVDAKGTMIPTHYELQGNTLIQVIDHRRADVQYPVVADPSIINCGIVTPCIKFNRSETRQISAAAVAGTAALVGTLCGLIPWAPPIMGAFKLLCAAWVAANAGSIGSNAARANREGRCLAIRVYISGAPLGSRVVNC